MGNFKLIHFYEDNRDELYNLNEDLSEQNDCSRELPEKAQELRMKLVAYLSRVKARMLLPNPDFTAAK